MNETCKAHETHDHQHGARCGHMAVSHDGHDGAHAHGPNCGHEQAPHGDHVDYLVGSHLHHAHNGHCDDHGPVSKAA